MNKNYNKKMIIKSLIGISFACLALAAIVAPSVLFSTTNQSSRIISKNLQVYELSKPTSTTTLSSFKPANIDIEKAIYGSSSINGGDYMLGYMTLTNIQGPNSTFDFPTTSKNWDWIQSYRGGASGAPVINDDTDNIVVNNLFLTKFFDSSNELNIKTKFYLVVDLNPSLNAKIESDQNHVAERFATPQSTWSQKILLDQFNYFHVNNPETLPNGTRPNIYGNRIQIDKFEDLPLEWRNKEGNFIRNDASADSYRTFINFINRWKPQVSSLTSSTNQESGFIAYTTTKTKNDANGNGGGKTKPFLTTSLGITNDESEAVIRVLSAFYLNK